MFLAVGICPARVQRGGSLRGTGAGGGLGQARHPAETEDDGRGDGKARSIEGIEFTVNIIPLSSRRAFFTLTFLARLISRNPGRAAGEGNRTLVSSLGSWRSTIELHPRSLGTILVSSDRGKDDRAWVPSSSSEFAKLFRERAVGAVGSIAQTKILVDLQQTLLPRDRPQKRAGASCIRK